MSQNIELLDTPGVLWPKFQTEEVALNLVFTGTIKDEILDKEGMAFQLVKFLYYNYLTELCVKYKLDKEEMKNSLENKDENEAMLELMEMIGKSRGAYMSGGKIDMKKTANLLLQDFKDGKIGHITIEKVKEVIIHN